MTAAILALDIAAPAAAASHTATALARAVAGLLVRSAAVRFAVAVADVYDDPVYPAAPAIARASAIYLLRIELGFTLEDVAALFDVPRRRVSRDVNRIEELRDGDQALDHWLAGMAAAVKGEPC